MPKSCLVLAFKQQTAELFNDATNNQKETAEGIELIINKLVRHRLIGKYEVDWLKKSASQFWIIHLYPFGHGQKGAD